MSNDDPSNDGVSRVLLPFDWGTLVAVLYLALWVEGASTMTIYVNKFHEQRVELVLFSIGQFLVPLTIYEIDQIVQKEREQ